MLLLYFELQVLYPMHDHVLHHCLQETLDKDKTKYLCGTAPWAAPEVLRGEKAQTHSDIW